MRRSGGFKATLKLLEFSLDGNNSRLELLSGSLVGHCHLSTSVQIKFFLMELTLVMVRLVILVGLVIK